MTHTTSSNKIIVWMQSSLDGRTAGPNGEFDWPVIGNELHTHFVDVLGDAGLFCYGRTIYQMMAGYWPTADESPESNANTVAYSRIWKPMPKLMFSRTVTQADWNTTVTADLGEIRDYADRAAGPTYVFGGAQVVNELARRDLVDEYQLFVHPVVLGGGTSLFPALADRQTFTLVEARAFDGTVTGLRYVRAR
ncbi:MAG TPA: dihydrofolate reductase family protein [Mycobacteriales bacterium]|nr:dihydrofolate reductase family protein [Mycobacteriales bacterium]